MIHAIFFDIYYTSWLGGRVVSLLRIGTQGYGVQDLREEKFYFLGVGLYSIDILFDYHHHISYSEK